MDKMKPLVSIACLTLALLGLLLFSIFSINACSKDVIYAGEPTEEFPLAVYLDKRVYFSWETISITVTVTNNSEQDVSVTTNGSTPWIHFRHICDSSPKVAFAPLVPGSLEAGGMLSTTEEFKVKPGIYLLDAGYDMSVYYDSPLWPSPMFRPDGNGALFHNRIERIVILVI